MGPSIVKKYGYLFESAFHPRSIRVPSAYHPRTNRVPSENPNLAKHPFGGPRTGRPGARAAPQMGVLLSLGSQMVRGWYADGTRMERGWNADLTFEGPMSYTLIPVAPKGCIG